MYSIAAVMTKKGLGALSMMVLCPPRASAGENMPKQSKSNENKNKPIALNSLLCNGGEADTP